MARKFSTSRFCFCILALLLCHPAAALTTICSGDFEPAIGTTTVKHEALWSFHDNWFFNLYLEMSTDVEGPVSPSLQQVFEMGEGGDVEHYLAEPPAGEYRVSGRLQVGYPASWGFDGLISLDCPAWVGELSQEGAQDEGNTPDSTGLPGSGLSSTGMPAACSADGCAATESGTATSLSTARGDDQIYREGAGLVLSGLLDAVDEKGLMLRTMTNRYVPLALQENYALTRSVSGNLADLHVGDMVGLMHGRDAGGALQLQRITVYRGVLDERAVPTKALPTSVQGLENRAVLQELVQTQVTSGEKVLLRLTPVQGELTLDSVGSPALEVVLVTPATVDALLPLATLIRVWAQQQSDGTLLLTRLDILN